MLYPKALKEKILHRFEKVIRDGRYILNNPEIVEKEIPEIEEPYKGVASLFSKAISYDKLKMQQWKINCHSLLTQIIDENDSHFEYIERIKNLKPKASDLETGLVILQALKDDFRKGFLGNISEQVSIEIAADYLTQAEGLINKKSNHAYNHVPAAVLAGAVLEKTLREICESQKPPIPIDHDNGNKKTLTPLIDDLKKVGLYNEAKAKQLRYFVDIRNHAAHGKFDEFTVKDVKEMINGINHFLSEYMG